MFINLLGLHVCKLQHKPIQKLKQAQQKLWWIAVKVENATLTSDSPMMMILTKGHSNELNDDINMVIPTEVIITQNFTITAFNQFNKKKSSKRVHVSLYGPI